MRLTIVMLLLHLAATVAATEVVTDAGPIEEVLVTGQQPGPGLWRATLPSAGHEHVLWIFGTHGPLPKGLRWRSAELEATLAASQEVVAPVETRASVGVLGGVTLLPSLVGIRRNPGGARLQDVLPADLYQRWQPLKQRYLGRDDDVEKWRPIFAAAELYEQALRESGLEPRSALWPQVEKLARRARVAVTTPEVEVEFAKPRDAIREFKQAPLADQECFARTLDRLESDLDLMRERAGAWATGDIARLRDLTHVDHASSCIRVVLEAQVLQERGAAEWPARRAAAWLDAVESAVARNASTVAVLPIEQILRPDGYVAQLRARGFVVEDP